MLPPLYITGEHDEDIFTGPAMSRVMTLLRKRGPDSSPYVSLHWFCRGYNLERTSSSVHESSKLDYLGVKLASCSLFEVASTT